jgi:PPK2 family polyphosphate:nucleotide phosphotransferase
MTERYRVQPGAKVHLRDYDPDDTGPYQHREDAGSDLERDRARLFDLQEILYAQAQRSLLIVLQAMDTGGKDGTISHVMGGMNPQGCQVASFKQPTPEELSHDFLWRVHQCTPGRGQIAIFNRSHYEDVLVVRVHNLKAASNLVPESVWRQRYNQINEFEELLVESGTTILKFFLHISKEEQKERLQARLDDPTKQWKFRADDLKERALWDDYMAAYEDALSRCSTEIAPWFIVPANRKWYRNVVVARIIVEALEGLDLRYPDPEPGLDEVVIED